MDIAGIRPLVWIGFMLIACGCASSRDHGIGEEAIGVGLVEVPARGLDQLFVRPGADTARYSRVLVKDLQVSYDERRRTDPVNPSRLDFQLDEHEMRIYNECFTEAISAKWSRRLGLQSADEPGKGVLVLETWIEDLYLYAPIRNDRPGSNQTFVGETSRMVIRARVFDAVSGETLLVSATRKTTGQRISGTGAGTLRQSTSVRFWRDASIAFEHWAREMARYMNAN